MHVICIPVILILCQNHLVVQDTALDYERSVIYLFGIICRIGLAARLNHIQTYREEAYVCQFLYEERDRRLQADLQSLVIDRSHADVVCGSFSVVVSFCVLNIVSQERICECILRIQKSLDRIHIVLRSYRLSVRPLMIAECKGINQPVVGYCVILTARILNDCVSILIGKGTEQTFLNLGQHLELIGISYVVDVQSLQIRKYQIQFLHGIHFSIACVLGRRRGRG